MYGLYLLGLVITDGLGDVPLSLPPPVLLICEGSATHAGRVIVDTAVLTGGDLDRRYFAPSFELAGLLPRGRKNKGFTGSLRGVALIVDFSLG